MKSVNSTGAKTHPCFTSLVISQASEVASSDSTSPAMSRNRRMIRTNFLGHPSFASIAQRTVLLTVSKAYARQMMTEYS